MEEQVKYVERASKKHKGKGEYVLTMVDPERRGVGGSGNGDAKNKTSKNSQKKTSSSSKSTLHAGGGAEMNQALKEVHRNKLQYYQAVPTQEMTQCFVERYRGDHVTSFHMHRQSDSAFVMAASMPCAMKGDIVFHTLQDMTWEATMKDISTAPTSAQYLGVMSSNFAGTQFTMHDYRISKPKDKNSPIHELGVVLYETNVTGRVPNSLRALVPRWDEQYMDTEQTAKLVERWQTLKATTKLEKRKLSDKLLGRKITKEQKTQYAAVEQVEQAQLLIMETKKPEWSAKLNAWTLNFAGRVKEPSKRNFMLVIQQDDESLMAEFGQKKPLLRFGKVSKDRYALDFSYPLSPVQAMGIALTTFAQKLMVT